MEKEDKKSRDKIETSTKISKKEETRPRILTGIVVSDKMDKTIIVSVNQYKEHPKYKKRYKVSRKYKVHDAENAKKIGDKVVIQECRPISKYKKWKVKK